MRIRRIPAAIAPLLAREVKRRLTALDRDKLLRVDVVVCETKGSVKLDPRGIPLADLEIRFKGTAALKPLASHILCREGGPLAGKDVLVMNDIHIGKEFQPWEIGYDPVNQPMNIKKKRVGWRLVADKHIETWCFNSVARQYATDDVIYTRELYKAFGCPAVNDVNSILACQVAAVRWRGFKIAPGRRGLDTNTNSSTVASGPEDSGEGSLCSVTGKSDGMTGLKDIAIVRRDSAPLAPGRVRDWLYESLDDFDREILASAQAGTVDLNDPEPSIAKLKESTKSAILEMLRDDELWKGQEISRRAGLVLDARKAKKEIELYDKFLKAGQFHASAKVVGTLSNRMSGDNDLNAQGINRNKNFRSCFPLAYDDMTLAGGDFDAFEVALGDAVFDDPKMREVLQTGRKIHAIFGSYCYPGMSYEDILATSGTDVDLYTRAKSGFFASILYGGDAGTLKRKLGIELENAQQGIDRMLGEFTRVGECIRNTFSDFASLSQSGGIGSKIEYKTPLDFVETKLGFKRSFTLENAVIKILFELAQDLPQKIRRAAKDIRVIRNTKLGREQGGDGACMTALYAGAFGLQGFVQRAANNHKIQAFGADITKRLQVAIWNHQPAGENEWVVQPLNIHDEIMCPVKKGYEEVVSKTVNDFIEEYRAIVPCIGMKWKSGLANWGAK